MAAPPKPWERFGAVNTFQSNPSLLNACRFPGPPSQQNQFLGGISTSGLNNLPNGLPPMSIPPPLPPRANQYGGYSPYNSYQSSYGSPFSMYGSPYGSSFGGYGYGAGAGYGLNRFGNDYGFGNNGFLQMAEESSRQAFQPLETAVHAIGSVYMMIESIYQATHNSFRAVIGVADQFSRLKMQLTQLISLMAVLKYLRSFFLRLAHTLGLRRRNPLIDDIWQAVNQEESASEYLNENDIKQAKFNWPIVLFVGVVIGMPWLLSKILSSITQLSAGSKEWASGIGEHFIGVASYDFNAESDREISCRAGQQVRLAPKNLQPRVRGWILASSDGVKTGLVPANYIKILGEVPVSTAAPASAAQENP